MSIWATSSLAGVRARSTTSGARAASAQMFLRKDSMAKRLPHWTPEPATTTWPFLRARFDDRRYAPVPDARSRWISTISTVA